MKLRPLFSLSLVATLVIGLLWVPAARADEPGAPVVRDGSTAARAAASCWDIKEQNPAAEDGTYWLLTPQMEAPQQFFCDQTMDGGGWVLIGRGREGWETWSVGKGEASALTTRSRTPADFDPVQLSNETIDGLLNGGAPAALDEGFRVVRAYDKNGTSWQTVDIRPQIMPQWAWAFKSLTPVSYRFNNGTWRGTGIIRSAFGSGGWEYVNMHTSASTNYTLGFAYGANIFVYGTLDSSSYIMNSGNGYMPYSEVYIRPRIASNDADFEAIPDSGSTEVTGPRTVSPYARRTSWGVVGNLNGSVAEGNIQVQAIEQVGDTMFVGGNFTDVQNGANGTAQHTTGLAAFDASTGAWKSSLTFDFNNQVKDLLALPDGRLLVVGDFTRVGGEQRSGTVVINPADGSIDQSWDLVIENGLSNGRVSVASASMDADFIYLAGSFTHLSGQGAMKVYGRSAARVSLAGKPDRSWNPEFFGTILASTVDAAAPRFYAGGHFARTATGTAKNAAAVSTETAALDPSFQFVGSSVRNSYQQAVDVAGDRVYFGGSEHNLFGYDTSSYQRTSASITATNGGDLQAITHSDNGVLYASCHCSDYSYQDADNYDYIGSSWTRADEIRWVGGWDSTTGSHLEWTPYRLASRRDTGAWALKVAADGALWVGGDFTRSFTSKNASQWNSGFAIYPARDTTPTAAPTALRATAADDTTVTLTWGGVDGAASYEVLRDDRVITSTNTTTAQVPLGGANRFFVRTVDLAGNRSASTPVYTPAAVIESQELLADTATWKYRWATEAPDASWATRAFDDSQWNEGAAPIGYGASQLGTAINASTLSPRPVTTYFRTTFTVEDPTAIGGVAISYTADDGAAVYVNGKEVQRMRLTAGAQLHHSFYADTQVSTARARTERASVVVASSLLTPGANTIAVETHLNYRSSPSMTMQATVTTVGITDVPDDAIGADPEDPTPEDPTPEDPTPEEPLAPAEDIISTGDVWAYWVSKEAPSADWTTELDLASWEQGSSPIGWGNSVLATSLSIPSADRAAAHYFSRDFEVMNLTESSVVTLTVRADDGAVVYLNGVEVGRKRMSDGPVTHSTFANAAISTANAIADPLVIEIPASQLREGTNRISVEEHLNYRSTPSMTFDATVSVTREWPNLRS